MKIFNLEQIQASFNIARDIEELLSSQKSAFMDFCSDLYDVPLPMQFIFPSHKSDCHIKGGYRQGSQNFIIKIAGSSKFGNNGAILIFDVATCELKAILKDEGFLTTLRTAIAGIAMLDLAPWTPKNIGIIGSGDLARQLYTLVKQRYLNSEIMFYARNKAKTLDISELVCDSSEDLVAKCDVVFTTTSSLDPIIRDIPKDTNLLIVALGSDDEHKSEVLPQLFKNTDMIVVDSKTQAAKFGDVSRALKAGIIAQDTLIELGEVLKLDISDNAKTIIADFSGIGAQDVAMTEFILSKIVEN